MLKPILQFGAIAALFFLVWFGLDRIDWMTIFQVEKTTKNIEEKLGDLYWDILKKVNDEITDKDVVAPIDSLLTRICERNDIDREKIKLHLVDKDEVNAFALPDYHMVVYTGLIEDCENEAELCGIIKEIGLSVLLSMTSGNGNPEIIKQAVKVQIAECGIEVPWFVRMGSCIATSTRKKTGWRQKKHLCVPKMVLGIRLMRPCSLP